MNKVWFRLGGYISLTDKEVEQIKDNEEMESKVLIEALKKRGFRVSGESYHPGDVTDDETPFDKEIGFDTSGIRLVLK